MPTRFLARDVKWRDFQSYGTESQRPTDWFGADCLNEFGTQNNSLSVWILDGENNDEIKAVATALLAKPERCLNPVEVAWISVADVEKLGLAVTPTLGQTGYTLWRKRHGDFQDLTIDAICEVGKLFAAAVKINGKVQRFTKGQVKNLAREAKKANVLDDAYLHQSVKDCL